MSKKESRVTNQKEDEAAGGQAGPGQERRPAGLLQKVYPLEIPFYTVFFLTIPLASFYISPKSLESFRTPHQALFGAGMFLALPLYLAGLFYGGGRPAIRLPRFWPALGALTAISLFSIFLSPNKPVSFREFLLYLEVLAFFFFAFQSIRTRTQVWALIWATAIVGVVVAMGSAAQYFFGLNSRYQLGDQFWDPFSTLGNKNYVCELLAGILPLTAALFFNQKKAQGKAFFFAVSGFFFVIVLITQTRGGWIGLAAAMIFMTARLALDRNVRHLKQMAAVGALCVAVMAQVIFLQGRGIIFSHSQIPFVKRFTSIVDQNEMSIQARKIIWGASWIMFKDNPQGLGIGAYKTQYLRYLKKYLNEAGLETLPTPFRDVNAKEAHNEYFHILVELGALGLLALIALIVEFFRMLARLNQRLSDPFERDVCLGAFSGLVSVGASAMFGFPFHIVPTAMCCACFLAILAWHDAKEGKGGGAIIIPALEAPALKGALLVAAAMLTVYGAYYSLAPWRGSILIKSANQCLQLADDIAKRGGPVRMKATNECVSTEAQLDEFHKLDGPHQAQYIVEKAGEMYRLSLKHDPHNGEIHTYYGGYLLNQKNDFENAEKEMKLAQTYYNIPQLHLNLGRLYYLSGRKEMADGEYREALALTPDDYESILRLALLREEEGRVEEALDLVRQAIQKAGDEAKKEYFLKLAGLYKKLGREDEAAQAYAQMLERFSGDAEALYSVALLESEKQNWQGAKELYERAIAANPGHCPSLNNLGNIYLGEKRYEEAVGLYRKCLEANPQYYDAASNLAAAYYQTKRHQEAAAVGEQLLKLALPPQNTFKSLVILGMVYRDLGQKKEALDRFYKACQVFPQTGLDPLHWVQAAIEGSRLALDIDIWGSCFDMLEPIVLNVDFDKENSGGKNYELEARRLFGTCAFFTRNFQDAVREFDITCQEFNAYCDNRDRSMTMLNAGR